MNKALFLDRDGVINVEKNYLYLPKDVEWVEGIIEICRYYQEHGYLLIVVTNQSGIARGMYTEEQFQLLSAWMSETLLDYGIKLDAIYHCPHHEAISGPCLCRKPSPGMLLQAKSDFELNMEHSVMIGDNERDIEAALNAGVLITYLLSQDAHVSKATRIIRTLRDLLPC